MSSFWKNRNAFVTGATGFVGAHVVMKLLEQGANVVCLQHDAVRTNLLDIFNLRSQITVVNGAVEDFQFLERVINEYEIESVFHLAGQALVGTANRFPLSTFETNIRGTYLLLEACRLSETVKRIVIASSDRVYGTNSVLPYHENLPLKGRYPYDVSKTCADLIAQSYTQSYQLPVAITRSSNIYGAGDLNLSRIIPGTIMAVLRNENPIIRSDGTPIREFLHIDDVTDGFLLLAEKIGESKGEAFNFGTNEPVQMLDLVTRIIKIMGKEGELKPTILLNTKIAREVDTLFLSPDKISKMFGWTTKVTLDAGLRNTIDWYQAHFKEIH